MIKYWERSRSVRGNCPGEVATTDRCPYLLQHEVRTQCHPTMQPMGLELQTCAIRQIMMSAARSPTGAPWLLRQRW
jgi:hypothetical protein